MGDCRICKELSAGPAVEQTTGMKNSVLAQSKNWAVIPSLGGYCKGYLLLVNKQHLCSLAVCPEDSIREFDIVLKKCIMALRSIYSSEVIFFEHGVLSEEMEGSNSVSHVHIHVLPFGGDIRGEIAESPESCLGLTDFLDLKRTAIDTGSPYLMFGDRSGLFYIRSDSAWFVSQHIRKIIAKELGVGDRWDWRENPFVENFEGTYRDLIGKIVI